MSLHNKKTAVAVLIILIGLGVALFVTKTGSVIDNLTSSTTPVVADTSTTSTSTDVATNTIPATPVTVTSTSSSEKESATGKCIVSGCSGQICSSSEGMASTCEYKEVYQCYKGAVCERQAETGKCGWTPTLSFNACIKANTFEGEADPSMMKLDMKSWNWVTAQYNDGRVINPNKENRFSITFGKDGKFSAKTDCNSVGGNYMAKNGVLTFSNIFMTEMYCENSQEKVFTNLLENVGTYMFTSKGELILGITYDSGTVTFR